MTICYADYTGHLSVKSNIYAFGVVLVEILTGLRVFDTNRPSGKQNLVDWIKPYLSDIIKLKQIMDSRLGGKYPSKAAFHISQLAINYEARVRFRIRMQVRVRVRVQDSAIFEKIGCGCSD